MNVYVNFNNFVSQKCWGVFLSPVWRRRSVTSDRQPLRLLTPLQVRPPFPVLMGIVSHMVTINQPKMITWQERNCHVHLKYVLCCLVWYDLCFCSVADAHYYWQALDICALVIHLLLCSHVVLSSQDGVTCVVQWRSGRQTSSSWPLSSVYLLQS